MQLNIPEELPYKILEKELELEHECSISVVNDLVNMYRQLIEAYESVDSTKFADFQTRLHKILMRSDVQSMLQQESKNAKKKLKESNEIEMKRQNFRSRKTASVEIDQAKISRHLSRIMENRKNIDKGTYNKAVNDIESQDMILKERLERRKRQSSIQTIRNFKRKNESDLSAGNNATNEREKILEELLERNFTEKAEELNKIKSKYKEKIKTDSSKSELFGEECDAEIKKQSEKYDQIRKEELQKFKEKYRMI